MKAPDLRATELQYEHTIIEAAKASGWLVHGERAAVSKGKWSTPIKGTPGFPDLVMLHPQRLRLLIVELKRKPNRPTADQLRWVDGFRGFFAAAGVADDRVRADVLWVPEELPALLRLLAVRGAW